MSAPAGMMSSHFDSAAPGGSPDASTANSPANRRLSRDPLMLSNLIALYKELEEEF